MVITVLVFRKEGWQLGTNLQSVRRENTVEDSR